MATDGGNSQPESKIQAAQLTLFKAHRLCSALKAAPRVPMELSIQRSQQMTRLENLLEMAVASTLTSGPATDFLPLSSDYAAAQEEFNAEVGRQYQSAHLRRLIPFVTRQVLRGILDQQELAARSDSASILALDKTPRQTQQRATGKYVTADILDGSITIGKPGDLYVVKLYGESDPLDRPQSELSIIS